MVVQGILAVRSIYDSVTSIPLTFGVLEALQTPTVLNITGNTTVGPELPVRIVRDEFHSFFALLLETGSSQGANNISIYFTFQHSSLYSNNTGNFF